MWNCKKKINKIKKLMVASWDMNLFYLEQSKNCVLSPRRKRSHNLKMKQHPKSFVVKRHEALA